MMYTHTRILIDDLQQCEAMSRVVVRVSLIECCCGVAWDSDIFVLDSTLAFLSSFPYLELPWFFGDKFVHICVKKALQSRVL